MSQRVIRIKVRKKSDIKFKNASILTDTKGMNDRVYPREEEEHVADCERQEAMASWNRMKAVAAAAGSTLIYPEQKKVAMGIFHAFISSTVLIATLCAPMQWGKTGVVVQVAYMLVTHITKSIPAENVIIITGMSDNEWRKQTKERMLPGFRIFHRGNLKKIANELKTITNALIVIDECHFAAAEKSTISNTIHAAGLMRIAALQDRNVRILQTSATPDNVLLEAEDWNRAGKPKYHQKIVPPLPASYVSPKDIMEDGRIRKSLDLTSSVAVAKLVAQMRSYETPKYHIIRLPTRAAKQETIKGHLESTGITIISHNSTNKMHDAEVVLSNAPAEHTCIVIKGFWRAAKTLPDDHLGVLHEVLVASQKSNSAESQSLVGRCCGHNKKMAPAGPIIYCDVASIENYIRLMESGWDYNLPTLKYHAQNIDKAPNSLAKTKPSYADPQNVDGIDGASMRPAGPPKLKNGIDFTIECFIYRCEGQCSPKAQLKVWTAQQGVRVRDPFKPKNMEDGFAKAAATTTSRVYLLDELKGEIDGFQGNSGFALPPKQPIWTAGSQTSRLYVTYQAKTEADKKKPIFILRILTAIKDCRKELW